MNAFHYKALPLDVYFDNGKSKETKEILNQHGYQKVLVLTTPEQEDAGQELVQQLGDIAMGVYPHAVMHVPVEVAIKAIDFV